MAQFTPLSISLLYALVVALRDLKVAIKYVIKTSPFSLCKD